MSKLARTVGWFTVLAVLLGSFGLLMYRAFTFEYSESDFNVSCLNNHQYYTASKKMAIILNDDGTPKHCEENKDE